MHNGSNYILYWMTWGSNPVQTVRAVFTDGTTNTWERGEKGFGYALRRANKYLNRGKK